jgi:two-component system cell cycle response regulator CtrA
MRILLVEDDRSSARGISFQLQQHRMVVDVADCGAEAMELAKLYDYDAIIVEVMLPDMEGFDVIGRLRAARFHAPVLMLSAINRTEAKVRALSAGADDYLVKPFDPDELAARVQAMIRRSRGFSQPRVQMGSLSLDLGAKEVAVQGPAGPSDRQGIRHPGVAGVAAWHRAFQGEFPGPPVWRHG